MTQRREPRVVTLCDRVYRRLLGLYPAGFRREYGPQMAQVFRDACRAACARGGLRGVLWLWPRVVVDLVVNAGAERLIRRRQPGQTAGVSTMRPAGPGASGALLLLAALAGLATLAAYGRAVGGHDLTGATMLALLLQTAILTLALSLPLYFGDLDLSAGFVAMLGVVLAVSSWHPGPVGPAAPWGAPAALETALPLAAALGAALGLAHGLLVVPLRLPAPLVTLVSGAGLGLALLHVPVQLAIDSRARRALLHPTLALFLGAVALTFLAALAARRCAPAGGRGGGTAATPAGPGLGWVGACVLSAPLGFLANLMTFDTALGVTRDLAVALLLTPIVMAPGTVLLRLLSAGRWRIALARRRPRRGADRAPGAARRGLARVAALTACGALAAPVGVLMVAQGIRDNTFLPCAAFVTLVPLAGLVAGGQQLLAGWHRPLGAIVGAVLAAAGSLLLTQPSDNLGGSHAIVLAALAALAWRAASGVPPARGGMGWPEPGQGAGPATGAVARRDPPPPGLAPDQ